MKAPFTLKFRIIKFRTDIIFEFLTYNYNEKSYIINCRISVNSRSIKRTV